MAFIASVALCGWTPFGRSVCPFTGRYAVVACRGRQGSWVDDTLCRGPSSAIVPWSLPVASGLLVLHAGHGSWLPSCLPSFLCSPRSSDPRFASRQAAPFRAARWLRVSLSHGPPTRLTQLATGLRFADHVICLCGSFLECQAPPIHTGILWTLLRPLCGHGLRARGPG